MIPLLCRTSKVSHGGSWRESCPTEGRISTIRDSYRSWLHRFVRLIGIHFRLQSSGFALVDAVLNGVLEAWAIALQKVLRYRIRIYVLYAETHDATAPKTMIERKNPRPCIIKPTIKATAKTAPHVYPTIAHARALRSEFRCKTYHSWSYLVAEERLTSHTMQNIASSEFEHPQRWQTG